MDILIKNYIDNPRSVVTNFEMAVAYMEREQHAAACSHFLRAAEWGNPETDKDYMYESLVHLSILLGKLGHRTFTEEGYLLHAISLDPSRREAYWVLSQVYERQSKWQESYTMASLALHQKKKKPFRHDIGFEGEYMIMFQLAVSGWWTGRIKESRDILFSMHKYKMNQRYMDLVQKNMSSVGKGPDPFMKYDPSLKESLRYKFKNYRLLKQTHGQVFQDLFVLSMLDGKAGGYYLEIGAAHPYKGNNTALLEEEFGWKGISIEYDEALVAEFRSARKNEVICKDATLINYDSLLKVKGAPVDIDYLQLDCEPPAITFAALLALPLGHYRFAVITYEHDFYADVTRSYRDLSRKYLEDNGYVLVVNDIARDPDSPFEDWWVHPGLVNPDIIQRMMSIKEDGVNLPLDYFFKS